MSTRKKLPLRGKRRNKKKTYLVEMNYQQVAQIKLSSEVIETFVELILEGLPIMKVCDYLGLSHDTYYQWKQKGEEYVRDLDNGVKPVHPTYQVYAIFNRAATRALAEWQLNIHRRSMQTDSKHSNMWIRDMTQLERRDRKNWSKSETLSVTDTTALPDEAYL